MAESNWDVFPYAVRKSIGLGQIVDAISRGLVRDLFSNQAGVHWSYLPSLPTFLPLTSLPCLYFCTAHPPTSHYNLVSGPILQAEVTPEFP